MAAPGVRKTKKKRNQQTKGHLLEQGLLGGSVVDVVDGPVVGDVGGLRQEALRVVELNGQLRLLAGRHKVLALDERRRRPRRRVAHHDDLAVQHLCRRQQHGGRPFNSVPEKKKWRKRAGRFTGDLKGDAGRSLRYGEDELFLIDGHVHLVLALFYCAALVAGRQVEDAVVSRLGLHYKVTSQMINYQGFTHN